MAEFTNVPDCLVLRIEEHDIKNDEVLTVVYILYDTNERNYVVRGNSNCHLRKSNGAQFSFICESVNELIDFLSFIICKQQLWTYVLYNYTNLPCEASDITYDFLNENAFVNKEIAAYDNQPYKKKTLLQNLRMLKYVFNYY
jgi:hypothetical protein